MNTDIVTCPECGVIVGFNSYFRRYMCTSSSCTWTSGIIEDVPNFIKYFGDHKCANCKHWGDCSSTKNAEETATWRMTKIMFRGKDCYENGN